MQKKKEQIHTHIVIRSLKNVNRMYTSRIINTLFSSKEFNSLSAAANKKLRNFKKPYLTRTADGSKYDVIRSIIDLPITSTRREIRNKKSARALFVLFIPFIHLFVFL